jgi:hypothetical protein
MCLLWGMNWLFISQKTAFYIVTAVKTSNLTTFGFCYEEAWLWSIIKQGRCDHHIRNRMQLIWPLSSPNLHKQKHLQENAGVLSAWFSIPRTFVLMTSHHSRSSSWPLRTWRWELHLKSPPSHPCSSVSKTNNSWNCDTNCWNGRSRLTLKRSP